MTKIPLSERLIDARTRARLSQQDLADAIGVRQATVSEWERGNSEPVASNLASLARNLSVSADWLIGLADRPLTFPRGHWLIDMDLVEKLRSDEPQPGIKTDGSEGWAAAIPDNPSIVSSLEYAALRRELASRIASLHRRRKRSP